jgi:hypothetical protein
MILRLAERAEAAIGYLFMRIECPHLPVRVIVKPHLRDASRFPVFGDEPHGPDIEFLILEPAVACMRPNETCLKVPRDKARKLLRVDGFEPGPDFERWCPEFPPARPPL